MKRILFLFMILGLGLSSCKKNDSSTNELKNEETFILNGEIFAVADVKKRMCLILQIDESEFTFVPDSIGFYRKRYGDTFIYKIEPMIEAIKQVKL